MPVFLHGLSLKNFRGIGPEAQDMAPFKEFNFFIGANNSGKSTVLDFISRVLPQIFGSGFPYQTPNIIWKLTEKYHFKEENVPFVSIGYNTKEIEDRFRNTSRPYRDQSNKIIHPFEQFLLDQLDENGFIFVNVPAVQGEEFCFRLFPTQADWLKKIPEQNKWEEYWNWLNPRTEALPLISTWLPQSIYSLLRQTQKQLPKIIMIPAQRKIGAKGSQFSDFSGGGLIERLMQLQNPITEDQNDFKIFDNINIFLQEVTSRPRAKIKIPHTLEYVQVDMDDKVLPLSSLGTGIEEVIMLAAFCTINENKIICIEEPETHLHPLLQRRLMAYLKDNTSNQYFISTHSPSFIDTEDAAIFHVRYYEDKRQTVITSPASRKQKFDICLDLGHKASELLQSNFIIWVEGPSDRIYLNHWIEAVAPELKEGTHYSIMFYGGRLLSHLSADDEEVNEFIDLRALNQHLAILIDSDKAKGSDTINATKQRVQKEFDDSEQSLAWVTAGREIENYIPHEVLQKAVAEVYSTRYGQASSGDTFAHPLHFLDKDSNPVTEIDKIKVARKVCEQPADFSVLDLRERVEALVALIQAANK